jgi:WS/DGAT/MGAT family acyltransferase
MWRIESDPVLRSPVIVVGLLDRLPAEAAVRESFRAAADTIPRLHQCVVGGGTGTMRWEDAKDFNLDHHLHFAHGPAHGQLREVLDAAEPHATEPFDPARPLWDCTVMDGLAGGHAAFILKFHHSLTDGVGGIELAEAIFDVAGAPPAKPKPATTSAAPDAAAAHQPSLVEQGLRMAKSVGHMLAPVREPLSPLFLGRGLDRRMEVLEFGLPALRRAAAAADVTVNEMFLSGVAGGLHDYHVRYGAPVAGLRFTMPISIRSADDDAGGNRFVPARFEMPIDDPDPVVRAHLAAGIARRWRHEPALKVTDLLADVLSQLPTPVVTKIFGSMLRNIDVDVVDVPGITRPAFLAGARVSSMWAFAPPTGAALSVTLLSHGRKCCVGVLADTKAVVDPELLRSCLEHAFDEILELDPKASAKEVVK